MMRSGIFVVGMLALFLSAPAASSAQSAEELVVDVARSILQGISEGQPDLLDQAMHQESSLIRVAADRSVRRTTREDFISSIGSPDSRVLLERMWSPTVLVDGPLAMVWTPYDFWIDGEFSHCGIDTFHFVLTDDGWKVASLTYNIRSAGQCEEHPDGPPS